MKRLIFSLFSLFGAIVYSSGEKLNDSREREFDDEMKRYLLSEGSWLDSVSFTSKSLTYLLRDDGGVSDKLRVCLSFCLASSCLRFSETMLVDGAMRLLFETFVVKENEVRGFFDLALFVNCGIETLSLAKRSPDYSNYLSNTFVDVAKKMIIYLGDVVQRPGCLLGVEDFKDFNVDVPMPSVISSPFLASNSNSQGRLLKRWWDNSCDIDASRMSAILAYLQNAPTA